MMTGSGKCPEGTRGRRTGVHRAASAAYFSWASLQQSFKSNHPHGPCIARANVHWIGYMFESCTVLLKHVDFVLNPSFRTFSQRFQLSEKHTSWTKALLRNQSSFNRSALTERKEEHDYLELQPVPRLFNALWKPVRHQRIQAERSVNARSDRYCNGGLNTSQSWLERHTRPGLDVALRNREGGHQLLAETWEQTAPTTTSTGFNAIAARLQRLGLRLGSRHILYGMTTAVNPAAMKQYLLMLEKTINDDPLPVEDYNKTFVYIVNQLCLTPKPDPGQRTLERLEWNSYRLQMQWFNVITGLTENTLGQFQLPRQFSLYDLGPRASIDCWGKYIDLLRVLAGESAVYHEYLRYKQIQQPSQTASHQSLNPNIDIARYLLNVTVRAIAKENLCFAYAVAQQHMTTLRDIELSTWQVLLADLDLFHTWAPKMFPTTFKAVVERLNDQVSSIEGRMPHMTALRELEEQVQKVEHELGVHWSGGESGYHVLSESRDA